MKLILYSGIVFFVFGGVIFFLFLGFMEFVFLGGIVVFCGGLGIVGRLYRNFVIVGMGCCFFFEFFWIVYFEDLFSLFGIFMVYFGFVFYFFNLVIVLVFW